VANHLVLKFEPGEYAAELGNIEGLENDWELLRGISQAQTWPRDAAFRMDDAFPEDLQMEDLQRNSPRVVLVSRRLKEFLEAKALVNNEFLPVAIINHKGRRVKAPYWIVHQVHLQACIDESRSILRPNSINPELISRVDKLVIDESRVQPDVRVFRPARFPFVVLFQRELAGEIAGEGFTGLSFSEIDEFKT
jgi:hypothetical protein